MSISKLSFFKELKLTILILEDPKLLSSLQMQ